MEEKIIPTEDVFEKMWGMFVYFQNESIAKGLLYQSYLDIEEEKEALRLAYNNTNKWIYFIKQGISYFQSAQNSELMVRPLLQYYGMTSLMKALILIHDPHYPRTTSVLQHGVTTRKKKKNNYVLALDEIKVQKNGLLPYFSQVVAQDPLPLHRKYLVKDLLSTIPELQDCFQLLFQERTLIPLTILQLNSTSCKVSVQKKTLRDSKITCSKFISLFSLGVLEPNRIYSFEEDEDMISLLFDDPVNVSDVTQRLLVRDIKGKTYLYLHPPLSITNEVINLFMLMYVLGMICRYDTELWGELIFSFGSQDVYLIQECLQLSLRKFPNLVLNYLFSKNLIFVST